MIIQHKLLYISTAILSWSALISCASKPPRPTPTPFGITACGDAVCNVSTELESCPLDCVANWTPDMDFVTVWNVGNQKTLTVQTGKGEFLYQVDWDNDGVFDQKDLTGPTTHEYKNSGIHTIRIRGKFPHMKSVSNPPPTHRPYGHYSMRVQRKWGASTTIEDNTSCPNRRPNKSAYLLEVKQWGRIKWENMSHMFKDQIGLKKLPEAPPDLSSVEDMSQMFCNAWNVNSALDKWDTSHIKTMKGMFNRAQSFNQRIDGWDTSNVTDMSEMFHGAKAFNQPIGLWDTSNVTDMRKMFTVAYAFNQPIGEWDTSNVTDMSEMFSGAIAFNQNIGGWDTSNVLSASSMFSSATSFNQALASWNTSNVTDMRWMFSTATSFNQDIGEWNTFNVTTMHGMFYLATSFNQDIGEWNTSNVTDMSRMFSGGASFTQNLGRWNLTKIGPDALKKTFHNSGMTPGVYDATLEGWAAQKTTPKGVKLSTDLHFCTSSKARQKLITVFNWTIEDKGKQCP